MRGKKGFVVKTIIFLVVGFVVLGAVAFFSYNFFSGKAIPFFKFLSAANATSGVVSSQGGIIRYSMDDGGIEYHDGVKWNTFKGNMDLGGRELDSDKVASGFESYLNEIKGLEFSLKGKDYEIVEVGAGRFDVNSPSALFFNYLRYYYNSERVDFGKESSGSFVEVGAFSELEEFEEINSEGYYLEMDSKEVQQYKLTDPELYGHLQSIDLEILLLDEVNFFTLDCGVRESPCGSKGYTWNRREGGYIYFNEVRLPIYIEVVKVGIQGDVPQRILVGSRSLVYEESEISPAALYLQIRDAAIEGIFARKIEFSGIDGEFCTKLDSRGFIEVEFDKEVCK
jgi:hypothetical protein